MQQSDRTGLDPSGGRRPGREAQAGTDSRTLRRQKVRTAVLFWEQAQEDTVAPLPESIQRRCRFGPDRAVTVGCGLSVGHSVLGAARQATSRTIARGMASIGSGRFSSRGSRPESMNSTSPRRLIPPGAIVWPASPTRSKATSSRIFAPGRALEGPQADGGGAAGAGVAGDRRDGAHPSPARRGAGPPQIRARRLGLGPS